MISRKPTRATIIWLSNYRYLGSVAATRCKSSVPWCSTIQNSSFSTFLRGSEVWLYVQIKSVFTKEKLVSARRNIQEDAGDNGTKKERERERERERAWEKQDTDKEKNDRHEGRRSYVQVVRLRGRSVSDRNGTTTRDEERDTSR